VRLIVIAARGEVEEVPGLAEATLLRREAAEAEDHRPRMPSGLGRQESDAPGNVSIRTSSGRLS
jgi:hypothetical protein